MAESERDLFAMSATDALFQRNEYTRAVIGVLTAFRENDGDVKAGATDAPSRHLSSDLLMHHATLFAQCNPRLARKISDMTTAHGDPLLLRETIMLKDGPAVDFLNLWNPDTDEYNCFEEILTVRDVKSGFQATAFFDHTHDRMVLDFGSTDGTHISDLFTTGVQMLLGRNADENRTAKTLPFTERAMGIFKERHPDLFDEAVFDLAGHGNGIQAMATAAYYLKKKFNRDVRAQSRIDPASGKAAPHDTKTSFAAEPPAPAHSYQSLIRN